MTNFHCGVRLELEMDTALLPAAHIYSASATPPSPTLPHVRHTKCRPSASCLVLEYYEAECSLARASSPQIKWALDDGFGTMLPVMQSDIVLSRGNRVLIIDAKYYTRATQRSFDVATIHSANLYQIFTYVKNKNAELADTEHEVSGMLLYAKTDEEIQPDGVYQMSGNQISVQTLNLNMEFEEIAKQLDAIAEEHFN